MSSAFRELSKSLERFLQVFLELIGNIFYPNDGNSHSGKIENAEIMKVNVKLGRTCSYLIDVKKQDDIARLKDLILKKTHNEEILNLKIIFAGKELHDSVKIQDYDIGQYSVLHAVMTNASKSPEVSSELPKPISDVLLKNEIGGDAIVGRSRICFYVYCSSCKGLCPGKLRVNCAACKQGTLTVDEDPKCWDDVLKSNRISGTCQTADCQGKRAEFYFKCASIDHDVDNNEENRAVALHLIRCNLYDVCCMICTDVCPIILVFPCPSTHAICLECFNQYCSVKINERQFVQDAIFGYTLPCPAGCENSLIEEIHHFRILDEILYEKYQRFGAEECLLQAGGVLCPRPNCGAGILPDEACRKVTCVQEGTEGCGFVFCRTCMQGYHLRECYDQPIAKTRSNQNDHYVVNNDKIDHARWNEASLTTIKVTTKPCPSCRTPTERNEGCMHMICAQARCGFHWCWLCQTEWTRDCMAEHWFG